MGRALLSATLSTKTALSPWQLVPDRGSLPGMTMSQNPYRGFRFPGEGIEHAVWLYHCFSLSLRDVELILAAHGIVVSYESIREWDLRFGQILANMLKRRRPKPGDKWYMDEVFIDRRLGHSSDKEATTRQRTSGSALGSNLLFWARTGRSCFGASLPFPPAPAEVGY